jgi:dGTPase
LQRRPELCESYLPEIGSIVSAACLAHDLGNPPFGHFGERAFSTYFSEGKGLALKEQLTEAQWNDLTHFEGNANAFRLLTHQFEGRRKGGFVLTYPTLASIVKYPWSSSATQKKSKFGFFTTEVESFRKIADELGIKCKSTAPLVYARHPLVYLVEAADDICYEIMDIEDSFKLKLLSRAETYDLLMAFFKEERRAKIRQMLEKVTDENEQVAYLRARAIGLLTYECTQAFLQHEEEILAGEFEGELIDHISELPREAYRHCAAVAKQKIYRSRDVVDIEVAGFRIIGTLIDLMTDAVLSPEKAYSQLLMNRVSSQYSIRSADLFERILSVLDYISGMTDVFALDLYRKINGNSLPAV